MGHKVNPISFRLGHSTAWQSKWFAQKDYRLLLLEDVKIRRYLMKKLANCYLSKIEIDRDKNIVHIVIYTARPGMIIGRSGASINTLREELSRLVNSSLKIDIVEVKEPNLDARLVAYNIAHQIEKRVSYKKAMKQAITHVMEAGAKGVKVACKGRLGGVEIARSESLSAGVMPLGTIKSKIDYAHVNAQTTYGVIGVKVWINVDTQKA